jgi:hypothetical protein
VWNGQLKIVLIRDGHPAWKGLDPGSREVFLSRVAWHEWGHALSVECCDASDVAAGERLLELAPEGVAERIRRGGYSRKELTFEIVADTYALLIARRSTGLKGRPAWLSEDIYELMTRVTGWSG